MTSSRTGKILSIVETLFLSIYIGFLLEIASYAGRCAYRFIDVTGHWFRSREFFASTFERGVLKNAEINLKKHGVADDDNVDSVIKDYLKFESRFALENIWIRKNDSSKIIKSFDCTDVKELKDLLKKRNFIIVTPHTPALYMLVSLITKLGHDASFVVMNPFLNVGKQITPAQKTILKLFSRWTEFQKFIFMENGEVFERCTKYLQSGNSIIMAPDTPSDAPQKVPVDFMQYKTMVAPGAAVISQKYRIPILAVTPWAENINVPFRLNIKVIEPENADNITEEIQSIMNQIFNSFEVSIRLNPAFWHGWLYWHYMEHCR
ncbi:MAG: hypothetical protein HQK62_02180 [Desulfamplus sp.]|nr:hypothetical protein [Desulfamplus sp.]